MHTANNVQGDKDRSQEKEVEHRVQHVPFQLSVKPSSQKCKCQP